MKILFADWIFIR